MIKGTIRLEDVTLDFEVNPETMEATYTITDTFEADEPKSETKTVSQDKFFNALAIAVHNDGMPDYEKIIPTLRVLCAK